MKNLSLLRNHNARRGAGSRNRITVAALRTAPFFRRSVFSKSTQNQYGCGPLQHNQQFREHFPLHGYTEPVQILCGSAQFRCRRWLWYT
jgi:hypothetical protein